MVRPLPCGEVQAQRKFLMRKGTRGMRCRQQGYSFIRGRKIEFRIAASVPANVDNGTGSEEAKRAVAVAIQRARRLVRQRAWAL